MKRVFILLILSLLLVACGEETTKEEQPKETNENTEEQKEEHPLITLINDRALEYGAKVDDVKVNEDANNAGEYIVLINFKKLNKKDSDKLYDELVMYSDDIAANVGKVDDVNTVVAFWELPNAKQGTNALKRAYTKNDDNKMYLDDEVKDVDIFR